jgi:hypothetical protein
MTFQGMAEVHYQRSKRPVPTILEALDHPGLFGPHFRGDSWNAWRAFLGCLSLPCRYRRASWPRIGPVRGARWRLAPHLAKQLS